MIKYVAYYVPEGMEKENRVSNPAGVNVMDYMKDVYASCDEVEILAPCRTQNKKGRYKKKEFDLNERIKYKAPATYGFRTIFGKVLNNLKAKLWLFNQLVFKTKKTDTVIVYHSPFIMGVVKIAKRLKGFTLIQEIREIYGDIWKSGNRLKKKEFKYFSIADKYIFATAQLDNLINVKKKRSVLAPGIYKNERIIVEKFSDGKIHLVYAGNLNKAKGGAGVAIDIARKLSDKYVMHVLGGGTPQQIAEFQAELSQVNSTCEIVYEGIKRGDDFLMFLQKCHIGLSTQRLDGNFNATSFPSKILTYMANGLVVVSSKIEAVYNSPIGDSIYYYDGADIEKISALIEKIDLDKAKSYANKLDELNAQLKSDFSMLIINEGEI